MPTQTHRFRARMVALLVATGMFAAAPASAIPVIWSGSVLLDTAASSGGIVNPGVLVGFNPQPEPPAVGGPTFPPDPIYPPDPIFPSPDTALFAQDVTGRDAAATTFRLLLGIGNGAPLAFAVTSDPDASGHLEIGVLDSKSGVGLYSLLLDLTTDSGGVPAPGTWVGFNPQPEPPALGPGAAALGFDFSFTSLSEVRLELRVQDAAGTPFDFAGFTRMPKPATLALVGLGLLGVARRR